MNRFRINESIINSLQFNKITKKRAPQITIIYQLHWEKHKSFFNAKNCNTTIDLRLGAEQEWPNRLSLVTITRTTFSVQKQRQKPLVCQYYIQYSYLLGVAFRVATLQNCRLGQVIQRQLRTNPSFANDHLHAEIEELGVPMLHLVLAQEGGNHFFAGRLEGDAERLVLDVRSEALCVDLDGGLQGKPETVGHSM